MPLDPSISLGINPGAVAGPSVGAMQQQAYNANALAQQYQAIQTQNALKQILTQPGAVDDDGQVTSDAMKQIMSVNPQAGMMVAQNQFKMRQQKMHLDMLSSERFQRQMEMVNKVKTDSHIAYAEAIRSGKGIQQAQEVGQQTLTDGIDLMRGSGDFGPEWLAKINPKYDNNSAPGDEQAWMKYQMAVEAANERKKTEARQEKHESFQENLQAGKEIREGQHQTFQDRVAQEKLELAKQKNEEAKKKAESGEIDDDTATKMARQYLSGDTSVMSNIGRGAQAANNIAKVRKAIYAEADDRGMAPEQIAAKIAEFQGLKAGERTLGTRTAQIGMAVSEAQKVAPLALEASEKVNRTNYPDLNSILLAMDKKTGGEDFSRFVVATTSLANVYSRAISPTGNPSVSDKEHARDMLFVAMSKGQYKAAVDQMMKEMAAAAQSPGAVREEFSKAVTGGKEISDAAGKPPEQKAEPAQETSPFSNYPDAKKGKDGRWYIHKDGKWFPVS